MSRGTNSLLFGAHQIFIHPFIVAYCWWKLYGFPYDPRLWFCFFVHDWGYLGCADMDGEDGKWHPRLGSNLVYCFLGYRWCVFTLCHSRTMCKMTGMPESKLCYADKLAVVHTPRWMFRKGELNEYISNSPHDNYNDWKAYANANMLKFVKGKDDGFGPSDYTTDRLYLHTMSIREQTTGSAATAAGNGKCESKDNDSLTSSHSICS